MESLRDAVDDYNAFASSRNGKRGQPQRRPVEIVCSVNRLAEIVRMGEDAPIALIHSVEGGHSLHGELAGKNLKAIKAFHVQGVTEGKDQIEEEIMANLQSLFDAGVACLTLAHFYPNYLAAPCFPYPDYALKYLDLLGDSDKERIHHDLTLGLTELGEKVVGRMLHLGMLVDVTHCTPAARQRVYQIADAINVDYRVIASHVGVQAINPDPVNLDDWEIEWIARRKGVVGIIFMPYWLQPHRQESGLNTLSRTIAHVVQVGGEDVIAFGSDFDGFTDPPDELVHYGQLPRLTQRLMAERLASGPKYPDALIDKILGGNVLRVLLNGWGKKTGGS
jgi:microsomal dipeptidase-like Zn-dependent dipeptidase